MKYSRIFIALLLVCAMTIPASAAKARKGSAPHAKSGKEVQRVAERILDNIMNGFKFDDYLKYSRDFSPGLRVSGARTKFYRINRYIQGSLGEYVSREYMGSLQKGSETIILWKGAFAKTKDDVLIKMVLNGEKNRYVVTGLWLQ